MGRNASRCGQRKCWSRWRPAPRSPPGVPRFVQVEIEPTDAKPGIYQLRLNVGCLDRLTELGVVTLTVTVTSR